MNSSHSLSRLKKKKMMMMMMTKKKARARRRLRAAVEEDDDGVARVDGGSSTRRKVETRGRGKRNGMGSLGNKVGELSKIDFNQNIWWVGSACG